MFLTYSQSLISICSILVLSSQTINEHMSNKILDKINSPHDIKGLSVDDLRTLCEEIRQYMIECCAVNPGHLGPSLGAAGLCWQSNVSVF